MNRQIGRSRLAAVVGQQCTQITQRPCIPASAAMGQTISGRYNPPLLKLRNVWVIYSEPLLNKFTLPLRVGWFMFGTNSGSGAE